jgi:hypothetical protein
VPSTDLAKRYDQLELIKSDGYMHELDGNGEEEELFRTSLRYRVCAHNARVRSTPGINTITGGTK